MTPHRFCGACGSPLAEGALACGACNHLVHSAELQTLAAEAAQAETAGQIQAAREAWERALQLLPPNTAQHGSVQARLDGLAAKAAEAEGQSQRENTRWKKLVVNLGIGGALVWKFKAVVLIALSKLKFLLLGLSKLSTLGSMFVSLGLYWNWWGWKFALGFVLSIYIHEMGHVAALARYGIAASAPMFLPGLGAVVRLKQHPQTPAQDARVGLAGPLWGLGATIAALAGGALGGGGLWMAVGVASAQINLFNLIPVWQLDGGRGFTALTKGQRVGLTVLTAALWAVTGVGVFFLILLGAGYKLFFLKDHADTPDRGVMAQFAALLVMLGLLCMVPVAKP